MRPIDSFHVPDNLFWYKDAHDRTAFPISGTDGGMGTTYVSYLMKRLERPTNLCCAVEYTEESTQEELIAKIHRAVRAILSVKARRVSMDGGYLGRESDNIW